MYVALNVLLAFRHFDFKRNKSVLAFLRVIRNDLVEHAVDSRDVVV